MLTLLAFARLAAAVLFAQVSTRTVGNLALENVPEIPPAVAERMLQYQNTRGAGLMGFAPDSDELLITTRFGETAQLHWVKAPGGARKQLTFLKEPISDAALRPKKGPRELVFAVNPAGSENYQFYRYSFADGKSALITDGKSRNEGMLWSRDGAKLVFNGTARNGKDFDFYLWDPESGARTLLLQVEGQWQALDWSPDDKKLLVLNYISINETYLHVLDAASGTLTPLFEGQSKKKIAYGTARWVGADAVAFTSDETGEFVRLGLYDLAKGKIRWLSADIPWNIEEVTVSHDGKSLAFISNEDGISRLYLGSPAGPFAKAGKLPPGEASGARFNRDGRLLGLTINSAVTPSNVFTYDRAKDTLTRWTDSETGGLPESLFIEPTLVHFPSFDSRRIPAFYYRPKGPGPFPVVVSIHGGPEAQERPYFSPTYQYWANELGIAILAPNVRGSDGYGKSYLLLDNGFKREDSVKDIGALLDWAAEQPELDAKRMAVYGGSYGGYMSLACLARFSGRLKAGIDVVGISNFVTFLKNTKDYRRDLRRAEYGDERDPAMEKFQQEISPTTLSGLITSPLFVIQGKNDPRVPAGEAEQIVAAVRKNGQAVWYLLAADEGHGFAKKTNRDFMGQAVSLFWESALKADKR